MRPPTPKSQAPTRRGHDISLPSLHTPVCNARRRPLLEHMLRNPAGRPTFGHKCLHIFSCPKAQPPRALHLASRSQTLHTFFVTIILHSPVAKSHTPTLVHHTLGDAIFCYMRQVDTPCPDLIVPVSAFYWWTESQQTHRLLCFLRSRKGEREEVVAVEEEGDCVWVRDFCVHESVC